MDTANPAPDLFQAEHQSMLAARAVFEQDSPEGVGRSRQALGDLLTAYERLLRETRRLVRRSDRAELEMNLLNQRLQDLATELEYRATHDPLTGVLNRAAIIERVNQYAQHHDLALIVLDIDHFKRINDSFGHPVGDTVILGVVDCIKTEISPDACIGRVGGEEFTVLLPQRQVHASEQVAQAMRKAIEAHNFCLPDGSHITASFGVSHLSCGGCFDDAYGLADEALYVAKRGGRNRVARATGLVPQNACSQPGMPGG